MFVAAALLAFHVSAVSIPALPCGCLSGATRTPQADGGLSIGGTIRDSAGGVVPGAAVVIRTGSREQRVLSGPDGRFTGPGPAAGEVVIIGHDDPETERVARTAVLQVLPSFATRSRQARHAPIWISW